MPDSLCVSPGQSLARLHGRFGTQRFGMMSHPGVQLEARLIATHTKGAVQKYARRGPKVFS